MFEGWLNHMSLVCRLLGKFGEMAAADFLKVKLELDWDPAFSTATMATTIDVQRCMRWRPHNILLHGEGAVPAFDIHVRVSLGSYCLAEKRLTL